MLFSVSPPVVFKMCSMLVLVAQLYLCMLTMGVHTKSLRPSVL